MRLPRFRVRTLMILVALAAVGMAAVAIGWREVDFRARASGHAARAVELARASREAAQRADRLERLSAGEEVEAPRSFPLINTPDPSIDAPGVPATPAALRAISARSATRAAYHAALRAKYE